MNQSKCDKITAKATEALHQAEDAFENARVTKRAFEDAKIKAAIISTDLDRKVLTAKKIAQDAKIKAELSSLELEAKASAAREAVEQLEIGRVGPRKTVKDKNGNLISVGVNHNTMYVDPVILTNLWNKRRT